MSLKVRKHRREHVRSGLPALVRKACTILRGLWLSYVERQARSALHLVLHSHDDRFLRDLGISREQIDTAVNEEIMPRVTPDLDNRR